MHTGDNVWVLGAGCLDACGGNGRECRGGYLPRVGATKSGAQTTWRLYYGRSLQLLEYTGAESSEGRDSLYARVPVLTTPYLAPV